MATGGKAPVSGESADGQEAARRKLGSMIGRSVAMERLFLQMRYLAGHLRIALVEGERGTGKRLAARTLHGMGPAATKLFAAFQAAAFLAAPDRTEQLAAVSGGTLYLSHVELLGPEAQLRLLHLLDRVRGSARALQTEFAGLAAPHTLLVSSERSLRPLALNGRFRFDLQQQLSLVRLCLPPLRERRADVALLAEQFAREAAAEGGRPWCGMSRDAEELLAGHGWPGNVAQLREAVRAAMVQGGAGPVTAADLQPSIAHTPERYTRLQAGPARLHLAPAPAPETAEKAYRAGTALVEQSPMFRLPQRPYPGSTAGEPAGSRLPAPPELNLDRVILRHVRWVLGSVDGNKLRAARLLGISRSTLYRLLESGTAKPGAPLAAENADAVLTA